MESHLVYATNNHSSQYEHRFELNSQSYMSESQGFESEGGKSHYDQFERSFHEGSLHERSFHEGSLLFHQQTFSLILHETRVLVKVIPRFKAWVDSGSIINTVVMIEDGAVA